jgi:hypothetical protein
VRGAGFLSFEGGKEREEKRAADFLNKTNDNENHLPILYFFFLPFPLSSFFFLSRRVRTRAELLQERIQREREGDCGKRKNASFFPQQTLRAREKTRKRKPSQRRLFKNGPPAPFFDPLLASLSSGLSLKKTCNERNNQ